MIRPVTDHDAQAVVGLAVSSGLFTEEDAGIVAEMMKDYQRGKQAGGHACVIYEDCEARAVGYYQPAPATDRTWYLTMIGVRRDVQGKGHGTALLRFIENDLQRRDQRLLLVETSGLPAFERTRAFYAKCGYQQEARIRDYYESGDDMVLFRKPLRR